MIEHKDVSYVASAVSPAVIRDEDGYYRAVVPTAHGFALVTIYGNSSTVSIILGGRVHQRRYERRYTPRYLATLAKRFAQETADSREVQS